MDTRNKLVNESKLALVGSYPPPYGGVSIHIQRLHAECLNNNIRCTVFAVNSNVKIVEHVLKLKRIKDWLRILTSNQDIIHVHITNMHWIVASFFSYMSRIKRVKFVLTYHSLRYNEKDFSPIGRKMIKIVLKHSSHCIVTNKVIAAKLLSMGADIERISVVSPFLPPVVNDQDISEIPQEVWDFIDTHTPVISANAFSIMFYNDQDLYGIDMCIDLCANLKDTFPQIGFVFCIPHIGNQEYFNIMKQRITEKGIENNFLFVTEPYQLYPILMKTDVFVRPTNTDGDAISISEALFFKKPVVASDVITRPKGTMLFKNRDMEDFITQVRILLGNYDRNKSKLRSLEVTSGLSEILEIYRSLADKT